MVDSKICYLDSITQRSTSGGVVYDQQGRVWSNEAINHLIVGRVHGKFTWTPVGLYMSLLHPELSDIPTQDLESFYNSIIPQTPFLLHWRSSKYGSKLVQEHLQEIWDAVNHAMAVELARTKSEAATAQHAKTKSVAL